MYLKEFFTEYDKHVSSDLNVDPLGLQVIWSVYGQKIFKNRVSSISNDVRNYTINLFHHYIIRNLIGDDVIRLSKKLSAVYSKKDTQAFKHACLIHLENIFVYSMVGLGDEIAADSSAVLGISKARRRWHETSKNPVLLFSHLPESQVLVRQITLGVSGRYKTPLVEMGFFDKNYTYNLPKSDGSWKHARKFIESTPELVSLKEIIEGYFKMLFQKDAKMPAVSFNDIPATMKKAYVDAFQSPGFVGKYSREFWLQISDLNKGAAGALLDVLDELHKNEDDKDYSARRLFALAKSRDLPVDERNKIINIEKIEPFLADIDLLFSLILSKKSQAKAEVINSWNSYKRDASTLKDKSWQIFKDKDLVEVLTGTSSKRLGYLLELRNKNSLDEQLSHLFTYHKSVMQSRGQAPWLSIDDTGLFKVQVKQKKPPSVQDKPNDCWVHQYYIPQFKNLVSGFQGVMS